MEDQMYGRYCEMRKTIERLRTELNKSLTEHPLNKERIIARSKLLDKMIMKCMECDITECPYCHIESMAGN